MAQLLSVQAFVMLAWFCIAMVYGQGVRRGEFFGDNLQGTPVTFPASSDAPGSPIRPFVLRRIPAFSFFGKVYQSMKIYRDGLIIFGADVSRPSCPTKEDNRFDGIAPFWLQTTGGTVKFRQIVKGSTGNIQLSANDLNFLKSEIKMGFKDEVQDSDITSVVLVTWEGTFHADNQLRRELKNTFQFALINTRSAGSFGIYIYRRLDIGYVTKLGKGSSCPKPAVIGVINASNKQNNFFIDQHFHPVVKNHASFYTNINDHRNLGRYIVKFTNGVKQPSPPTIQCRNNPDPICRAFNWFKKFQVDTVTRTFCQFREPGIFPYPFTCNQFVKCGTSKDSFKLLTCPKGTNFNNQLAICDDSANYECQFSIGLKVTNDKGMTFVLPTPQAIIHDNFCFLRLDGIYTAQSDCSKYLRCHNSRGTLQKCPANLFWQPAKDGKPGFCDWPRNVDCGTRSKPITTTTSPKTTTRKPKTTTSTTTTTTPTTTTTTTTIAKPTTTTTTKTKTICDKRGPGFFPDPRSCKNFVRCLPGVSKPVELQCPRGLYFNPTGFDRGNCNFPQNVCCFGQGNRDTCSPPPGRQ